MDSVQFPFVLMVCYSSPMADLKLPLVYMHDCLDDVRCMLSYLLIGNTAHLLPFRRVLYSLASFA